MNEKKAIETIKYAKAFNSDSDLLNESLNMAISALEKQIPKNPVLGSLYSCPNCKVIMFKSVLEPERKYCTECGQKLDWSNEGSE